MVLINYSAQDQKIDLTLKDGFKIAEIYGEGIQMLPAHEAVIIKISERKV